MNRLPSATLLLVTLVLVQAPASAASSAERCDGLYRLTDSQHAVEPGVLVEAADDIPAHCRVRGTIDGTIRFEVTLPLEGWSGRFLFHAPGGLAGVLGDTFSLLADQVFKATGQVFLPTSAEAGSAEPLELADGRIAVNADRQTSLPDVFAGGDCVAGIDLTVSAVEDGKQAAHAIDRMLRAG